MTDTVEQRRNCDAVLGSGVERILLLLLSD